MDSELSARLENTEATASTRFIEARSKLNAASKAEWAMVAGACLLFDGVDSPMTQSFGLGMNGPVTGKDMERIEAFFRDRHAPVFLEVSPLANDSLLPLLNERRYQPIEYTNVMCRSITAQTSLPRVVNEQIRVRRVYPHDSELWAQTSARGWSEHAEFQEFILGIARTFSVAVGATAMLAEISDQPIATGVVLIADKTALLAGASTVPEARKQGAQSAILEARLAFAAAQGCNLAMMCASPGSPSQRNAQRNGFQIAYTRTKWQLRD